MTLRLFVGFIAASLMQFLFVIIADGIGLSSLIIGLSAGQLILHFVVGQMFGWAFYYIWRRTAAARAWSGIWLGVIYGLIVWAIVSPLAAGQGLLTPAWNQGGNLVVSSTAFMLYGIFVALVASATWRFVAR